MSGRPLPRLGPGREFGLIERALAGLEARREEVTLGWGDDAAILQAGSLAVSTDLSVEGVHFRRAWMSDAEIGHRATVAALSDMAAVAADPVGVLLSVGLPTELAQQTFVDVVAGVREACATYGADLIGGDLSRMPADGALTLDVICLGSVAQAPVRRSGGEAGDEVWVTGSLGGAAQAVAAWTAGTEPSESDRVAFTRPKARIAEARWLHEKGLMKAAIDVSDGVGGDLTHLAVASGVDIEISTRALPRARGATAAAPDGLDPALDGGEDYELLFLSPANGVEPYRNDFEERFATRLTELGRVVAGTGALRVDGADYVRRAFDHFDT